VAPLADVLEETHTDAFVALHEGAIVLEWYGEERAERDLHPIMSITKSLVGCVAGVLMGRGELDPTLPVTAYVPELAGSGYASATVRDVLDMRTSVDYREVQAEGPSGLAVMGQVCGWLPRTLPDAPGSLRSFLRGLPPHAGPQAGFVYRSADTEVLAWVVERAAGVPLQRLFETLLTAVGAEAPGALSVDPDGVALASGGLSLRPRDLARLGQLILDGGAVGSEQVLPTAFIRDTRTGDPGSQEAFRSYVSTQLGDLAPRQVDAFYRNQFWVLSRGRRLLGLGVHGQMLLVDWENAAVVVKLSGWPDPRDPRAFGDSLSAVESTARALGGEESHAWGVLG
jgi:CubicO group peptidase (beta-lactamase class C family)